jgi:hypothetical protein
MSRFTRIVMLVMAITSLFAVMSSSAGAVTWTNTGATAVHATGAGLRLHVGASAFSCTASTLTGTAPLHGATSYAVSGTILFTPCTLLGQPALMACTSTLTAITHVGGVFGGLTTSNLDLNCNFALEAAPTTFLCHLTGATPGSYTNPAAAGGTGTLTLHTSVGALVMTNGSGGNCPFGTAASTLTHTTFITTAANTPIISTD